MGELGPAAGAGAGEGAWPELVERVRAAWHPWLETPVLAHLARHAAAMVVLSIAVGLLSLLDARVGPDVEARLLAVASTGPESTATSVLLRIGSLASFTTVLAVAGAAAVWARARSGHWRLGQLVVVTTGGALAIVGTVKLATLRPRPPDALYDALSASFPSGHSARAMAVAGLVAWLVSRRIDDRRRSWVWAPLLVFVGLVGWSRLALGMHWPSDVVVGLGIGAWWLAVVLAVVRRHPDLAGMTVGDVAYRAPRSGEVGAPSPDAA